MEKSNRIKAKIMWSVSVLHSFIVANEDLNLGTKIIPLKLCYYKYNFKSTNAIIMINESGKWRLLSEIKK